MNKGLAIEIGLLVSVVFNFVLFSILGTMAGAVTGGEDLQKIYLEAACSDRDNLRAVLMEQTFEELPVDITLSQKQEWVEGRMALCDQTPLE